MMGRRIQRLAIGNLAVDFIDYGFDFFAFDLRRNMAAMPALWAVLHVAGFEAPTRHEQLASARRGYTVAEVEEILRAAGVPRFHIQSLPPAFFDVSR